MYVDIYCFWVCSEVEEIRRQFFIGKQLPVSVYYGFVQVGASEVPSVDEQVPVASAFVESLGRLTYPFTDTKGVSTLASNNWLFRSLPKHL